MITIRTKRSHRHGFALVVTLSLMILLTVIAVGLLSLSAISLRSSSQGMAQAEARANARLALVIAIGELQKEMGPDMRVSGESALFDSNPETEKIDNVTQSHWLASYNSWGNWLNANYTPPGSGSLKISATYTPRREQMFRRWLLSLPEGMENDPKAPLNSSLNDSNSVVLVGEGSIGKTLAANSPDLKTRAYLTSVGTRGKNAWWISPENQKAKITLIGQPRSLAATQWEQSQGATAEVGIGALEGYGALDAASDLGKKLITTNTLRPAQIDKDKVDEHFFDLTASSEGVVASVRGSLKKDLSLLFEMDASKLPAAYKYTPKKDIPEPSIRPMSRDLLDRNPKITNRHFASWTNMRHYYRMYRNSSDANTGVIGSSGALKWASTVPYSEAQIPLLYRDRSLNGVWQGDNSYNRLPVLAKLTFIYSLISERVTPGSATDLKYRLYLVYTPVFTYWNPYNTELRIPDNTLGCLSSTYQVLPMRTQMYLGNVAQGASPSSLSTGNAHSFLRSGNGNQDIIFKPGEIRIFSHDKIGPQSGGQTAPLNLMPGFNPLAYGGDKLQMGGTYLASQNPGVAVQFSYSEWGGNINYGNTPGSLCHTPFWLPKNQDRDNAFNWNFPVMYQNDWFNLAQTFTPMTPPGAGEIARWVFSDSNPVPVAYAQLVIKGMSEFSYESIASTNPAPNNWAKDWRCRNWISSPPYYFGNDLYMSEDATIAHTERLDNPYVMNFGPLSDREMGKVVGHPRNSNSAFLGSGSNPYENITSAAVLELPTAPVGSLASFSGMRINPGWAAPHAMNPKLSVDVSFGDTSKSSYAYSLAKMFAYQSGVTGPGIGNSFMHPMLPRTDIYQDFNNSVSADPPNRVKPLDNVNFNDNMVFRDYWDHVFLLNDALWDDYFVSSLADQKRPSASNEKNLSQNLDQLVADKDLSNIRYHYYSDGKSTSEVKADLQTNDGYLKAAKYLMVDGMFNVNSTSVPAWHALFSGIRERQLVYRDAAGELRKINVPSGKRIALSRFDTEISDQEMTDPGTGATLPDGSQGWTGVRYLDDDQLLKLAQECVKQVKLRGPFLNFSEFINRRLSADKLGIMGALQSAIDYDDAQPDTKSINYRFKKTAAFMLTAQDLGTNLFKTPAAAEGSRLAGIPGYLIQSDLLKPIANTLAVRDDTFRIRAYGQANDAKGKVTATAYCEAIVQRMPDYCDPSNDPEISARQLDNAGSFTDNNALTDQNRRFGRKFQIMSFRWVNKNEI